MPFNKSEFIIKIGSKETQSIEEEQYDEDSNGRKEQGNVFTAIFLNLRSARIQYTRTNLFFIVPNHALHYTLKH